MFGLIFPPLPWANHWNVVLIGAVFLVMQLFLCLRFWYRMKRHWRRLSKLLRDLETGGDGRDLQAHVGEIPWLQWVDTNFPRGRTAPGNYTRDDALKELDTQIASDGDYLLLQRAGVMAPLLGVIITVLGFLLIDFSQTGEQSLGELLLVVAPLIAGVGTGALLAFINQWLLHLVGGKVERVRYAARAWFDTAIWRHLGLDTQTATIQAIQAMQRMARSVNEAADREQENVQAMREGTASIRVAAHDFQETQAVLDEQLRELPGRLAELTASLEYAVDTLDALIPLGQRATEGMDTAVGSFRTAVEERFAPAATTHHASSETLAESLTQINESTLRLRVSSGDLHEAVKALDGSQQTLRRAVDVLADTSAALQQSLTGDALPAHRVLHQAANGFTESAQQLSAFLANGLNPVTQRLTELDQTFQSLEQAAVAVRDLAAARQDIEHLTQALAQSATIAQAIANLPDQIRSILEQSAAPPGGIAAWFRRFKEMRWPRS
jgi:hypothetical protein